MLKNKILHLLMISFSTLFFVISFYFFIEIKSINNTFEKFENESKKVEVKPNNRNLEELEELETKLLKRIENLEELEIPEEIQVQTENKTNVVTIINNTKEINIGWLFGAITNYDKQRGKGWENYGMIGNSIICYSEGCKIKEKGIYSIDCRTPELNEILFDKSEIKNLSSELGRYLEDLSLFSNEISHILYFDFRGNPSEDEMVNFFKTYFIGNFQEGCMENEYEFSDSKNEIVCKKPYYFGTYIGYIPKDTFFNCGVKGEGAPASSGENRLRSFMRIVKLS